MRPEIASLFTDGRPLVGMLYGKIGFHRQQARERVAFLFGKLPAKTVRVENGLALWLRHLAKIAEGAGDQAATVFRKSAVLLHRAAELLPLRRSKALHRLGVLHRAPAL